MIRNKLGSLKRELKKINAKRAKKIYNSFVSEEKNKAVVKDGTEIIFEGSYFEYQEWLNKRGNYIIQDDFFVQWDWELRDR